MYYISLDESGDFENFKGERDTKPVFIAGVVFDSDEMEMKYEKNRIRAYLKAVCRSVSTTFPKALHVGEGANKDDVAKTKRKIGETIQAFFNDGDYPGKAELEEKYQKRKGKYYLYCYLKGENGKSNRLADLPIERISDDHLGNLYVHMAEDIIERLVFHNPVLTGNEFTIQLATRKFVYDGTAEGCSIEKAKEYRKKLNKEGYEEFIPQFVWNIKDPDRRKEEKDKYKNEKASFRLTDQLTYWKSIERAVYNSEKPVKLNGFSVEEINYNVQGNDNERNMTFLYLADIICSILPFNIPSGANYIDEIGNRARDLLGDNVLFYVYDDVDTLYGKALRSYERGNCYEALEYIYDALQLNLHSVLFYKSYPIKRLLNAMRRNIGSESLYDAITKLNNFAYSNDIDRKRLTFMFREIARLYKAADGKDNYERFMSYGYDLYSAGVSAYTHFGDGETAYKYYEECSKYEKYVNIEKILVTTNKLAVFYQDRFRYKEAYQISKKNIEKAELVLPAIEKAGIGSYSFMKAYAIAISQYGQIVSFVKPVEAKRAFEKALAILKEDKFNYYITLSYYLHLLIEMGDVKKYEKVSEEYFSISGLDSQLKSIFDVSSKKSRDDKRFAPEFALYLYVKGLYSLYEVETISPEILEGLRNIDKKFVNKTGEDHPWELIYKYLAFIFYRVGDVETANAYMEKTRIAHYEKGQIIDAIILHGELEYKLLSKDEYTEKLNELTECMKGINWEAYDALVNKKTNSAKVKCIDRMISYTFD